MGGVEVSVDVRGETLKNDEIWGEVLSLSMLESVASQGIARRHFVNVRLHAMEEFAYCAFCVSLSF